VINLSGESAIKSDAMHYQANFSSSSVFVNMWGATETGFVSQYFMDKDSVISSPMLPIGYAIQDKDILLLDDCGTAVGFNEIGEIAIRSRYLSPGYWKRPDADRAAFSADSRGYRIYRTGDLGRMLPDGCVLSLERKDFQVKIRGHRVELAEAEAVLLEHPLIKEGVIVAREDQLGDMRLVAYVTSSGKPGPNVSELRDFLKAKLPDHMIPSTFVLLDALPHTPNNKIDRNALPEPAQSRPKLQVPFVPPGSPTEQTLVQIWADVLKLDQVGVDDNFFDLGGNSLLASQVISRVIKTFTVELPMALLFNSPTVAEMATTIDDHPGKPLGEKELANILDELESLPDEKAQQLAAKIETKN
jgi:non-ribosomal peptide synthetase component F